MMKKQLSVALLGLGFLTSGATWAQTQLTHWPAEEAKKLGQMIKQNANKGNYAVFDMDNTSYQYDLTESLLPYLESKGVLTRENLDPALKLVPFKDTTAEKESLYSYYVRLCEIDDLVCYPWIAQSFSGLSLKELKKHVDDMIAGQRPIAVKYYDGGKVVSHTVRPPKPFAGMQELYAKLQENGINVYVMTAANEELVRMVAADPKYGYNVKPENVIGVNVLLKNRKTGALDTSRLQIKKGQFNYGKNMDEMKLTAYLMNPMTWYEGKYGSIVGWIDQWRKPVLVAGDTAISDGYMLLNATDTDKGGYRVWVDRKPKYTAEIKQWRADAAKEQAKLGLPVTADKNWIVVKPDNIHKP